MKKTILTILTLAIASSSLFAKEPKETHSKINKVTVYLRGAQIERTAEVQIQKGTSELIFTGLTSKIQANTIRVGGKGNFVILNVSSEKNYLQNAKPSAKEKALNDSLEFVKNEMADIQAQIAANSTKKKILSSNLKIKGKNSDLSIEKLKKAMDYFSKQTGQINKENNELSLSKKKTQTHINNINQQLRALQARKNQASGQVVVTVQSERTVQGNLNISYYIADAGWTPSYDIRVKNLNDKVDLIYKANVWQNSYVDWKNVEVALSTGNPTVSGTKPQLNPLYIDFYTARPVRADAYRSLSEVSMEKKSVSSNSNKKERGNLVTQKSNELSTTFHINRPYSIPSDGKKHKMEIATHQLNSSYHHFAAPKLNKNTFLLADVTDWNQYKLLPGNANIYFKGNYVGKSAINPNKTDDTLKVSLGIDKNIIVERKSLKDFTKNAFIGKQRTKDYKYEIKVKNNGNKTIKIKVKDQIPVSKQKDIKVDLEDKGDAHFDSKTGILSWDLSIEPNNTAKKVFSYSIKYPKDKKIQYK